MFRSPAFLLILGVFAFVLALSACSPAQAQQATPIHGTIAVADDDAPGVAALARITPEQAQTAALARFPGATVTEVDLDEEDGFLVYEVDLTDGTREMEVLVDAGSGEILQALEDLD